MLHLHKCCAIIGALLNIPEINTSFGHPVVGGSWERFVIENMLSLTPAETLPFFIAQAMGLK
jgi:hypothetical protein